MSHSRNNNNVFSDKNGKDVTTQDARKVEVTLSTKDAQVDTENACSGQKSFISIHSTDLPFQIHPDSVSKVAECNVEVLSLKECFPSTSEESLVNEDDSLTSKNTTENAMRRATAGHASQKRYSPSNSKSTTDERVRSGRQDVQAMGHSDFDIPKSTLYVIGSDPGEPKKCYNDPPKKISKTMRKFLRSIDKQPSQRARSSEARAHLTRGILKGRRWPECTGDAHRDDDDDADSEQSLSFVEWSAPSYTKQGHPSTDKNVTFNTEVIIIHFTGDLCVGQSVETLSKERDQQARNSELRRTFLTKYNEFWPQKL